MNVLLYVVGACLIIYALQLAVVGLAAVLAIAIVIGFFTRPREMLLMIVSLAAWSLLERFPGQTILGLAALSALSWIEAGLRARGYQRQAKAAAKVEKAISTQPLRLPPP